MILWTNKQGEGGNRRKGSSQDVSEKDVGVENWIRASWFKNMFCLFFHENLSDGKIQIDVWAGDGQ